MASRAEWAARKGRSSKWIGKIRRAAIYIRDGFRCSYCGEDLSEAKPREMGLDHLIPQSNPRCTHDSANLVTVCRACNSARQDKPWRKYATPGAVKRIMRQRRRKLNIDLARALVRGEYTWTDH